MDTTESTVKDSNQIHDTGVSDRDNSSLRARDPGGLHHAWREGMAREVNGTVPSKKRKETLPPSTRKKNKVWLGIRLLSDQDFRRATEIIPTVCGSFTFVGGDTFLVSERSARALEKAFRKEGIHAEHVTVTWSTGHTPIIHSGNGH